MTKKERSKIQRKIKRVRSKIRGVKNLLRLSVFRSNKRIYAQIINDQKGVTLVSASDYDLPNENKVGKTARAAKIGEILAKKAKKLKLKKVVFDRGKFAYHGRIKALADAARKGGLEF